MEYGSGTLKIGSEPACATSPRYRTSPSDNIPAVFNRVVHLSILTNISTIAVAPRASVQVGLLIL